MVLVIYLDATRKFSYRIICVAIDEQCPPVGLFEPSQAHRLDLLLNIPRCLFPLLIFKYLQLASTRVFENFHLSSCTGHALLISLHASSLHFHLAILDLPSSLGFSDLGISEWDPARIIRCGDRFVLPILDFPVPFLSLASGVSRIQDFWTPIVRIIRCGDRKKIADRVPLLCLHQFWLKSLPPCFTHSGHRDADEENESRSAIPPSIYRFRLVSTQSGTRLTTIKQAFFYLISCFGCLFDLRIFVVFLGCFSFGQSWRIIGRRISIKQTLISSCLGVNFICLGLGWLLLIRNQIAVVGVIARFSKATFASLQRLLLRLRRLLPLLKSTY